MIPAKTRCPTSWTREYYGWLVTERETHYRSTYTCLDFSPEAIAGGVADENPSHFYYTFTDCNGLPCPLYVYTTAYLHVLCTRSDVIDCADLELAVKWTLYANVISLEHAQTLDFNMIAVK